MNAGIDYGMGQSNIDKSTGIRYGVISQHSLSPWLVGEEFEPEYGPPTCPKCGDEVQPNQETKKDHYCESCDYSFWSDEAYCDEPVTYTYERHGYQAHLDSHGDVWLTKSPCWTWAQFCSPCAPGAGHLDNPLPTGEGAKTYCWSHDCFEGGKAPYPVYSVKGDVLLEVEEEENDEPS